MGGRVGAPRFEIWQVGAAIHAIHNPVRLKILAALAERPRTLTDLVRATHKAKSTLSALHMPPLLSAGLVRQATHPRDARVKVYRVAARRLGSSDVERRKLREAVLAYAQGQRGFPVARLFDVVDPARLVASGADPAYVRSVAQALGRALAPSVARSTRESTLEALSTHLASAGLGRVRARPGGSFEVEAPRLDVAEFVQHLVEAAASGAPARRDEGVRRLRAAEREPLPTAPS